MTQNELERLTRALKAFEAKRDEAREAYAAFRGEAAKLARQGCMEAHDGSCGFAAKTLREAARLAEEADFQRRQFDYYWGRMNELQKQIQPEGTE